MTPERWRQIDTLLDLALEQEPSRRASFLVEACNGDEVLRREVEALLAAREEAGHFLEEPALAVTGQASGQKESQPQAGRSLGPYEVVSLLGRGGMGEVYRARDTRLDRMAALKLLPPEVAAEPERLRRFVREAKAASALNHPNIATIYEIGESEGVRWIAMELVEGETLAERLSREALEVSAILDIGIQVAEALEEAHSKGITHRDIKPANLMLTAKGRVKVLDFGLAKVTRQEGQAVATASSDAHTFPGLVMGTARYMSPEQVLGQEVDHRTDLFSVGAVLYEMVTGRQAFAGQTSAMVFDAILYKTPTLPAQLNPRCPGELERIINKALEKDRELRYQTASELQADLKRAKRDIGSGELAAEASQPRRGRSLLWGTALLLAAITVATGLWYRQSRNETPDVPLVAVPFTSYPGLEYVPSFSPDGNQVAFMWKGENKDNFDIYIKQIGSESPRRLTSDPHDDIVPAWSPDGQSIAFARRLGDGRAAVMLIPVNGGRERQAAEFRTTNGIGWHPSGKWLAVGCNQDSPEAPDAIYLLSPLTHERRRLTSPLKGAGADARPAFSPDGRMLAFVRDMGGSWELYLQRVSTDLLPEGEPKQLTFMDQLAGTPAWTPDGKEIIFALGSKPHDWILWRISTSGSGRPKPLPFSGEGLAFQPAISLNGHRLVYTLMFWDINIWRCQIPREEEKPTQPSRLIPSTRVQEGAQYSPDGKSIAYVAWTSGSGEIWVCDSDGTNPSQLTHLGGRYPALPRWRPDGQQVVFDLGSKGRRHLFAVAAQGGRMRQLSYTAFNEKDPTYSRDGKWIYFDSNRSGVAQVWKMPAEGGEAVQVTRNGGTKPLESMDGRTLFYLKEKTPGDHGELWKVPVEGGEESRVMEGVIRGNFDVKLEGIYYASKPDRNETPFFFYDFASGKTKRIATIQNEVEWGFSVSPDERWILFTQGVIDRSRADLMLVENFR